QKLAKFLCGIDLKGHVQLLHLLLYFFLSLQLCFSTLQLPSTPLLLLPSTRLSTFDHINRRIVFSLLLLLCDTGQLIFTLCLRRLLQPLPFNNLILLYLSPLLPLLPPQFTTTLFIILSIVIITTTQFILIGALTSTNIHIPNFMNPALLLLHLLPCLLILTNSFTPFLLLFLRLQLGLNSLNLQPRIRQRLVNRQRKRLQQLHVEGPHIPPLPRHDLHDPIDGRHHILHNRFRAHRRLGDPHHATSPRPQEQQRRATRPLDLLLPILVPQIHGHWDLLLLEELLPQQPGQERHDALIGEEHVVGVAELALGLEGLVVGLELGEPEDLGDGDSFGTDLLRGVVFGEIRLGPVVDDEA
ncbi:hypothetical protein PanWU01x14_079050, partial [Parasponia andersonii]